MLKVVIRYTAYLAFAACAIVFWGGLLLMQALGDPACKFEPQGCPPRILSEQIVSAVIVWGAMPITALVFVFYRKLIRHLVGMESQSNDR